ncbi:MAG: PilZ domain-containing protein [bacterium]|nr:PilZ domain-containing protein [bacterium]
MYQEKRTNARFEPPEINVSAKTTSGNQLTGYLLDISSGGLAIDLPEKVDLPDINSKVEINVRIKDYSPNWISLGYANVSRRWTESTYFDNGKGVALILDAKITDQNLYRFLLKGTQQHTRLIKQDSLASQDINHLSAYRRSLSDCQIHLFTSTITLSVSFAAAYFALNYYGIVTKSKDDIAMSFWRTLVAALPGIIAIVFGLMVSQKNASIQRIDAYLTVLKECLIKNSYPREYKGWETESFKLRHVMNTTSCENCEIIRKCGTLTEREQKYLDSRKLFTNPPIDIYYIIMYFSFYAILIISTIAVVFELQQYQWGLNIFMLISSTITLIMLISLFGIFYLNVQLRKGKYSIDYYKRCWIDLLSRCRKNVIL